jgi:di/tricarboxylate transporter
VKKKFLKKRVRFQSGRAKRVIREQYRLLGRIRYAEVVVLSLFVLLALLWLFREPRFIPGWASVFRSSGGASYFSDSSTAMFVVFLMFVIPSRPPCWGKGQISTIIIILSLCHVFHSGCLILVELRKLKPPSTWLYSSPHGISGVAI